MEVAGPLGLSSFTFTFHIHALQKEMATHSSVLAWRIPGTGEPGGLPSMGLPLLLTKQHSLVSLLAGFRGHPRAEAADKLLPPLKAGSG